MTWGSVRLVAAALALGLAAVVATPARNAAAQDDAASESGSEGGLAGKPAGDRTVDLDAAPATTWLDTEHWYGIYRGDLHVGWLRRSLRHDVADGGAAAVVREMEQFVDVAGDGNGQRTFERALYAAEAPQSLLRLERSVTRQAEVQSRVVTRTDGRFDVVTHRGGESTRGAVVAFPVALADELVLERLVAEASTRAEGPVGAAVRSIGLDIGRMRPTRRILSVRGVQEAEGQERRFLVAVATGPDAWSESMVVDGAGSIVSGPLDGVLAIRRMSADEAQSATGRTSLEVATRVRMDAALGDVETLVTLRVALPVGDDGVPCPFPVTGRQEVAVVDGRHVVSIHRQRDSGEVDEEARAAALVATSEINSDDETIVAAATRVLTGTSQRVQQVVRLLEFTAATVADAAVLRESTASEILRDRRGDCSEHTRLFVALARAAGIPARPVTGIVWMGDDQRTFGRHAWAEVELAGRWREVDPTGGRSPAHAAHLRLEIDEASLAVQELELVEVVR